MKNYRLTIYLAFSVSAIGIGLSIFSYFFYSIGLFFLGGVLVVGGILLVILLMSLNLFIKDKELEIDKLRKMGLTIIECQYCAKENVLEDQYCIYCGESLGSDKNELQEEHKT